MSRKLQKDQLPADITVVTENLEKLNLGPDGVSLLPLYMWRDFVEERLRARGNSTKVRRYLEMPPHQIVPHVLRRGSVNLGGGCHVIKCPVLDRPGVCALCPLSTPDGERIICSGPTAQRHGRSLTLKKRTRYDKKLFRRNCPFVIARLDPYDPETPDAYKHLLELVYPVVKRRADYDTIDYRKEHPELLEKVGIE